MELTTEQSNSNQPPQPPQQDSLPSLSFKEQEDSPQEDSPQEEPSQLQSSDDVAVEDLREQAEALESAAPQAEVDDEPAGILEENQDTFSFESFDDIDIESIPADARRYVQPILDHAAELKHTMEVERLAYESTRTQFSTLMDTMDEAVKGNLDPSIQEYQQVNDQYTQVSTENVAMAHRLFELEYSEYETQDDKVKKAFVKELSSPSFNSRFLGENLYDKMVDAYKITVYRNGGIQPGQKQQPQAAVEVAPVRQPDPKAAKQALVSGGEMAPNMPTLNLQEMSYDDILARGEHLLDL